MLQRTQSAAFLGGAYVFPGGALDAADNEPRILRRVVGLTDAEASARLRRRLGRPRLLGRRGARMLRGGRHPARAGRAGAPDRPERAERAASRAVNASTLRSSSCSSARTCSSRRSEIAYFGHWITAPGRSRRFDHALLRRARARGPARLARRDPKPCAQRLDHAAGGARARARRARSSWCTPTRISLTRARALRRRRARAFEYAREPHDIEANARLLGAGQGRAPSCSAATIRRTSRSTGAIPEETGQTMLRPRARHRQAARHATSRASSRPTPA